MAISSLYIENFKGIGKGKWINIKPVTVFIGENSSGKSSCIHALACLSQTLKVPNNSTPIVMDDEYANVHLGRFIEVIHSKSYQDTLSLGIMIDKFNYISLDKNDRPERIKTSLVATYEFKCAQRTQDIRIESASIKMGDLHYSLKKVNGKYLLLNEVTGEKVTCALSSGFLISPESIFRSISTKRSSMDDFIPLISAQNTINNELISTLYLGPFRESPRRKYETRGANPIEVGARGESAITMLANESFQTTKRPHIKQIANWLKELGLAEKVSVSRVGKSDLVDLQLKLKDGDSFPIADLGYGLSQILPVLTQCSFADKGSTLLFEQPEIHLHTKSSRQLAKVFIDTAREKSARVILETHSPDLVKQFMQEIKSGNLKLEDFSVYRVSRVDNQTCITEIEIDADNDFDVYENWEKGISK